MRRANIHKSGRYVVSMVRLSFFVLFLPPPPYGYDVPIAVIFWFAPSCHRTLSPRGWGEQRGRACYRWKSLFETALNREELDIPEEIS